MRLPLQTYELRSAPAASSRLVNCYVEKLPEDARAPYLLRRCPGVETHGTILSGTGSIRKLHKHPLFRDQLFYALDESVGYYLPFTGATGGGATAITPSSRMDFANSTSGVVLVSQPSAYSSTGASFSVINDADFTSRGAGDVEFLDQYMLFREPASGRFFRSDVGSVTAYTSTNFATAESSPDLLVGMKSNQSQILLFGGESLEIWDTTGGSGFGFRPVINGSIGIGCSSSAAVAEIDNQVLWVADDASVRSMAGQSPQRVSTPAIEQILTDEADLSSVEAEVFSFDGHSFYYLYLHQRTLCYDLGTGLWHERQSAGANAWKWRSPVELGGDVYIGNRQSRAIARLTNSRYDEPKTTDSTVYQNLPMQWTYMPVFGGGKRVFHDRLEIVMETGVGLVGGNEPMLSLEFSDDGRTWQAAPNRSIGNYGERFQRVQWHGLGAAYQRIYRATVTEPVPVTVTDTLLDARGGLV